MLSTTTTTASAYATTSSTSLHSPTAERSGESTVSTSSSASTSLPSTGEEERSGSSSASSPPLPSLRSQLKLREILLSDHDRRDVKARSALQQRQDNQQQQTAATSSSASSSSMALPFNTSTHMLTSLSADARMGGETSISSSSYPKRRDEVAGAEGAKSSSSGSSNHSSSIVGAPTTAVRSGTSTPKRQIASPGGSSFEAQLAATTAGDATTPHRETTAPRSSSARRVVAPPLYTSRSSPLLDRHTSAIEVNGYAAASPTSTLQRQQSLRQSLERQSRHSQAALATAAAPPSQTRTEAGFTVVPSVRSTAHSPHDHSSTLDTSQLGTMHRQRSAGSSFDAKVVILGSQGVGKTSLVHRYTSGLFNSASMPSTIGASFLTKKLVLDGVRVRLQLWDTAGQERFRSMAPMYYRGANAALIVYDITNPASFDDVKSWIDELRENVHSDLIIHVVGAKADLAPEHRHVDLDEARHALALWTRPEPPSPPQQETPLRQQTSFFGSRRTESASPPSPSRTRGTGALPSASMSTSRLLDLGALVGMRTKSSESRDAPSSEPSTGNGSATHEAGGGQLAQHDGTAIDWLPEPDAWDYIDVTEVSAKDNDGVEDVFSAIATRLVERREQLEAEANERKLRQRQSIFLDQQQAAEAQQQADAAQQSQGQYSMCCTIA